MYNLSDTGMTRTICEWITVAAPVHIHNVESTASQSWLAVLQALDETGKQEGFQDCDWSRVLEQPSHIYIWISWVDKSAYDAKVVEKTHRLLYETLESLSTSEVNTKVIQYDQAKSYAIRKLRKRWPSITLLKFSESLSQEQRDRVKDNLDMTRCVGVKFCKWFDTAPLRGLVLHDTNERESQGVPQHDTWIILDYWWTPIREEEIKSVGTEEESKTLPRGTLDRAQAPPPQFVSQLSALGCKSIETRHMRFARLVTTTQLPSHSGFVMKPKSLEFDWVGHRKYWKSAKKSYMGATLRGCCRWMYDEPSMKRRLLLARGRDVDAERENERYGLRANGQLKRKWKDYKGMC